MTTQKTTRIRTTCAACDVILEPGRLDDDGSSSSGICPPCLVGLYGDLGLATAQGRGPHEDPNRARRVAEYVAGLETDSTVTVWTRDEEPVLWIRVRTDDGLELVRAEVLARDGAANWYVLNMRLEPRTFNPAEIVDCSIEEA